MVKIYKKIQITLVFQKQIAYNNDTVIICRDRMQRKWYIGCLVLWILMYAVMLTGCGKQDGEFYDIHKNEGGSRTSDDSSKVGPAAAPYDSVNRERAASLAGLKENPPESGSVPAQETDAGTLPTYYVHICGAVMYPGVYEVPAGSRLYEVILLAGGMCADACDYLINQAQAVSDGMQVYIPAMSEVQGEMADLAAAAVPDLTAGPQTDAQDVRVNINSATKEQLMTLPGVGETRAQAILDYRRENGAFLSIEDLMKVNGIKQGVYDRLKDLIKV